MRRRLFLGASVAASLARPAFADTWPSRPLKLVAPFAPGGGSDFTSRLIAEKLSGRLGQTMLVDNKPGAGGNLGAEAAIKSAADGYTFLTISGSYAINAILHKPSFDSLNDIVAIGQFTDEPGVLAVHPSVPAKTLAELVALAKRDPGKLAYGSSGPGGLVHLSTEFLLDAAGVKATHVPYRGTALALNDLIAGNLQMLSGGTTTMLPYVRSGQVRAIAITSKQRLSVAPDIATYAEQGYGNAGFNLWHGMIGPKGIPDDIVRRVNGELDAVLKSPEISERLARDGVIAVGGSSEAFMATIRAEVERWQVFIKRTGLKLEWRENVSPPIDAAVEWPGHQQGSAHAAHARPGQRHHRRCFRQGARDEDQAAGRRRAR